MMKMALFSASSFLLLANRQRYKLHSSKHNSRDILVFSCSIQGILESFNLDSLRGISTTLYVPTLFYIHSSLHCFPGIFWALLLCFQQLLSFATSGLYFSISSFS
ncbi:uncharacterized protein LOC107847087 isoform X2 [Capsicum annuum]|uniref:uncharacterized protein LOC107847087 isoform X2 n=1 Tax=Capsicum annuum TaxID=4072 RepID=UPI001FB1450F|nr:uncharacterized protein LOC107847087 isoform X2 [Capsicum annuum]